ncbi:hypothetical protein G6F24_010173 [Rhizopus arrhizus]|nr:hypothetical protein G6F24_010173 [Rhizopus arrhizus]
MQSETVLVGLLLAAEQPPALLLLVATTDNVLGSAANWLLGRYIEHFRHRRWFPVQEDKLQRARQAYHRYGRWSLLLSWVPIIGDPLCVIAGVLREPFWSFLLIVLGYGARPGQVAGHAQHAARPPALPVAGRLWPIRRRAPGFSAVLPRHRRQRGQNPSRRAVQRGQRALPRLADGFLPAVGAALSPAVVGKRDAQRDANPTAGAAGRLGRPPWRAHQPAAGSGDGADRHPAASATDVRRTRRPVAGRLRPRAEGAALVVVACHPGGAGQRPQPLVCRAGPGGGYPGVVRDGLCRCAAGALPVASSPAVEDLARRPLGLPVLSGAPAGAACAAQCHALTATEAR